MATKSDTRKPWQFTMPDHDNPASKIAPGTEIILQEPDERITEMALEMSSPDESRGDFVYQHSATTQQLRLCLVRVGDVEYTFEDLEGSKLDEHFAEFDKNLMIQALQKLTTPQEAQVDDFLSSAAPVNPDAEPDTSGGGDPEGQPDPGAVKVQG